MPEVLCEFLNLNSSQEPLWILSQLEDPNTFEVLPDQPLEGEHWSIRLFKYNFGVLQPRSVQANAAWRGFWIRRLKDMGCSRTQAEIIWAAPVPQKFRPGVLRLVLDICRDGSAQDICAEFSMDVTTPMRTLIYMAKALKEQDVPEESLEDLVSFLQIATRLADPECRRKARN